MREHGVAEENRAFALGDVDWRVATVEVLSGFRLQVHFEDGTAGAVDMSELVNGPNPGVFAALADPRQFAKATVDQGVVT